MNEIAKQTGSCPNVAEWVGAVTNEFAKMPLWPGNVLAKQIGNYVLDSWQRSILLLDIMRQRGNDYFEHSDQEAPHVLTFDFEVVMTGRDLSRPVNYALVRIVPPADVKIDPIKRPFIVFDPRAGHGPGIGGMKHDSEIGVALSAGHPCYYVGFTPNPFRGQTVEDVCRAEAAFVQKVVELHPAAEGRPCLIGNCQAGWQIMMMAALRPDLVGPILLAGTPLSYWAGIHGKNPMRYFGGLVGGTWLTSLIGDLGHGIFDGAHLIENFEFLDPSNTHWKKLYNVYAKVDTEGPRFLEFERWWGSPVLLNAAEMQFIADELFVGNKLSSGEIATSDKLRIDLRKIKSPIVVFCSHGDNITPPHQALGWILDLYHNDNDLVASGQTIVYALHQTIGHLGLFVSSRVAAKEHQEFTQTIDLIDVLPPGLYEAVIREDNTGTSHPDLGAGKYVVRFEPRNLAHVRALGENDAADEMRFATVARASDITQGFYRTVASPVVRSLSSDKSAEWMRSMHPHRVRYEIFSDRNPLMKTIPSLAQMVREQRRPAGSDNWLLQIEHEISDEITSALNTYRDMRDAWIEGVFMAVYGSPFLQAFVGLRADSGVPRRRIEREASWQTSSVRTSRDLAQRFTHGGLREATVRSLLYIGLGHKEPGFDERTFDVLRQIRSEIPACLRISLALFKDIVREQWLLLELDDNAAMAAISDLLPEDVGERERAFDVIRKVVSARGGTSVEVAQRISHVRDMFITPAPVTRKVSPSTDVPASREGRLARSASATVKT